MLLAYLSNHISPAHIWLLAFFGLAYPFLLLINLAFVFFWWWRKKTTALISLAVILIGWGHIGRYLQLPSRQSAPEGKEVSLLSFNVRLFNFYEWENDKYLGDSILHFVQQKNPEILCFQEYMTRDSQDKISESYLDSMLSDLPYKHVNFTNHSPVYGNYGLATYSSFPVVGGGTLKFEDSFNSCIYSDLLIGTDTLRVFNVHLQSIKLRKDSYTIIDSLQSVFNQKHLDEVKDISGRLKHAYIKRAEQVDKLSVAIRQSPHPVIVCGDFNDTPVSYTYHSVRGKLRDAFIYSGSGTGNTYRGNFPSFRIDYIFHSSGLKSTNFRSDRLRLSDHFPISCNIIVD